MTFLPYEERPANEKWLVYDNRAALAEAGLPGLHAFIAGVSNYAHLPGRDEPATAAGLGLRRLTSTSLTAYLIFDWLLKVPAAGR